MSAQREWEPGDPLPGWHRQSIYQGFLFNFRDLEEGETCNCPDRASWPEPVYAYSLDRHPDEFEQFIAEYHEWKEQERG